ncbi:hypothetical protein KFU94_56055 [Chloroflexi bacterium TSY]|nr:hypothetical protein [Chloroflexi bacterium TSY]
MSHQNDKAEKTKESRSSALNGQVTPLALSFDTEMSLASSKVTSMDQRLTKSAMMWGSLMNVGGEVSDGLSLAFGIAD